MNFNRSHESETSNDDPCWSVSAPLTKESHGERPKSKGMVLVTEQGFRMEDPLWVTVENAIEQLDEGHGNSFAVLLLEPNTYVQVLRGLNGFHLEWRITGDRIEDYLHYRASCPDGSTGRRCLLKHDGINEGQGRDLLPIEAVIDAFRAFFDRKSPPSCLAWRFFDPS